MNETESRGISFLSSILIGMFITFLILKLAGVLDISYFLVFLPLICVVGPALLLVLILAIILMGYILYYTAETVAELIKE